MANSFSSMLDLVYPTGSIFWSMKNTSPVSLFGGQWSNINSNNQTAFLLPIKSSATASTAVTIPKHTHTWVLNMRGYYSSICTWTSDVYNPDWTTESFFSTSCFNKDGSYSLQKNLVVTDTGITSFANTGVNTGRALHDAWGYDSDSTTNTSYEQAIPPFRQCYAWNRTA